MTDAERIVEAIYAAVAGIALRGRGIGPQEIVDALERAQVVLDQVKAYWTEQAREHVAEMSLRGLRPAAHSADPFDVVPLAFAAAPRRVSAAIWPSLLALPARVFAGGCPTRPP